MKHRIQWVRFRLGTNEGPPLCECGEAMKASDFATHRREAGLAAGGLSDVRAPQGYVRTPVMCRRGGT